MTITERLMGPGDWQLTLRSDTPSAILQGLLNIDTCNFGHIIVTSIRLADTALSASMVKSAARWSGVIRRREHPAQSVIAGAGLSIWISDEDGKDDYGATEEADFFGGGYTHFNAVLASGVGTLPPALAAGTITDIVVGTSYASTNDETVSRLSLINAACAYFGAEWRVSANFTFDAGPQATLWSSTTTPRVALLSRGTLIDGGRDLNVTGVPASVELDADSEDLTTFTVLKGAAGVGSAGGTHSTLKDPLGNPLKRKRVINESTVAAGNENAAAQAQLNRFLSSHREVSVEVTGMHDVGLDVVAGDSVWCYAPEESIADASNQLYYRGQVLFPQKLRVTAMTWPVVQGMGVYYLPPTASPVVTDLSDYIDFEDGATRLEVGAVARPLPFAQATTHLGVRAG